MAEPVETQVQHPTSPPAASAFMVLVMATTGAGPHAGDSSGQQVARRIPVALRDMAELHSSLALLLIGVTIGLVVGLHMGDVPERVRRAGRILLAVFVAQAAVGYTQYFTHLPALLVEVHIVGVTALVIGTTQTFLTCTYHAPEALPARGTASPNSLFGYSGNGPRVSRCWSRILTRHKFSTASVIATSTRCPLPVRSR